MDPLSAIASVITVLQLFSKVAQYITSAVGALKDRKDLRDEVYTYRNILQQLKNEVDDSEEDKAWLETVEGLKALDAPLSHLWVALNIIKAKLQPKEGVKRVIANLKWPFKEKKMEKMFKAIEREKLLL